MKKLQCRSVGPSGFLKKIFFHLERLGKRKWLPGFVFSFRIPVDVVNNFLLQFYSEIVKHSDLILRDSCDHF